MAKWLVGIINGRGGGVFDPYASISRQEVYLTILRLYNCTKD